MTVSCRPDAVVARRGAALHVLGPQPVRDSLIHRPVSQPSNPHPYRLRITRPAARALTGRLPEKVAAAVSEFLTTVLVTNPHRLGKQLLLPPYAGTWSARRGAYRVLHEIDDEQRVVTVTAVEHRGDVCDGPRLASRVRGVPCCPSRSLAAPIAWPPAARACIVVTSPRTQARACALL